MTTARLLVTVAGAAAMVWVLWYFLATPAAPPSTRNRKTG